MIIIIIVPVVIKEFGHTLLVFAFDYGKINRMLRLREKHESLMSFNKN